MPTYESLKFELEEENIDELKDQIMKYYKASAFNKCVYQKLPLMSVCPPLELQVREEAEPVAVSKPASIPLNWMSTIKEKLDK